jgi:hypothetical protein
MYLRGLTIILRKPVSKSFSAHFSIILASLKNMVDIRGVNFG